MKADELFDLIENTVQSAVNNCDPPMHVYSEREMRGTFPVISLRVMPVPREKKPKPGAKVISPRPQV